MPRVHCYSNEDNVIRDTCYYFVLLITRFYIFSNYVAKEGGESNEMYSKASFILQYPTHYYLLFLGYDFSVTLVSSCVYPKY